MSSVRCGIIELSEDNEAERTRWVAYMNEHRADVDAVFRAAGIELESFFLTKLEGKEYLISYIRILDEQKAHQAHLDAATSSAPVTLANERFRKATWKAIAEAHLLFDHKTGNSEV